MSTILINMCGKFVLSQWWNTWVVSANWHEMILSENFLVMLASWVLSYAVLGNIYKSNELTGKRSLRCLLTDQNGKKKQVPLQLVNFWICASRIFDGNDGRFFWHQHQEICLSVLVLHLFWFDQIVYSFVN